MAKRETQMRDARLEVIVETRHRRWQILGVGRCNVVAQQARQRGRGRLVAGRSAGLELRPDVLGHYALQVSHLVRQAALAQRARQAFLDRADHPGRPVTHHQQRVGQAAPARLLGSPIYVIMIAAMIGRTNGAEMPSAAHSAENR